MDKFLSLSILLDYRLVVQFDPWCVLLHIHCKEIGAKFSCQGQHFHLKHQQFSMKTQYSTEVRVNDSPQGNRKREKQPFLPLEKKATIVTLRERK